MNIKPAPARSICNVLSLESSLIILHDGNNASVALELVKLVDDSLWRGTEPAVVLDSIATFSSHFANADRYLLLGASDDEKMRLLIAPHDERTPVIKTLSLTFAEARARLETKWGKLHGKTQE